MIIMSSKSELPILVIANTLKFAYKTEYSTITDDSDVFDSWNVQSTKKITTGVKVNLILSKREPFEIKISVDAFKNVIFKTTTSRSNTEVVGVKLRLVVLKRPSLII